MTQAGQDTETRQFQAIQARHDANETRMRDNQVAIATVPEVRAALAKAAAPVIADWTTRAAPEGAAILAAYRRT